MLAVVASQDISNLATPPTNEESKWAGSKAPVDINLQQAGMTHGAGTEIRYQDPSALPWSKMATATTGKDVYTAIIPGQWWLDLV